MKRTTSTLALALLASSFFVPAAAEAAIPPTERAALLSLFLATDGPRWTRNEGWRDSLGSECEWYGVTCNAEQTTVVALQLSANGLRGDLPPAFFDFENLASLDLSSNRLGGSVPLQLGALYSLQYLDLSSNELSGEIPETISKLYGLTSIELDHNQLAGPIPAEIGRLADLQVLYLQANQLGGGLPLGLFSLTRLAYLDLSANQLAGSIPDQIGNLKDLTFLSLAGNRLSGFLPPELGDLLDLAVLRLDGNQLRGEIPSTLLQLANLLDGGSDLRFNALQTADETLRLFLDAKQAGGDWQETQTLAPFSFEVAVAGQHTVWTEWQPVDQLWSGGYEIYVRPHLSLGGGWELVGWTNSLQESRFPATSLKPGQVYDFAVSTYRNPHSANPNRVVSSRTPEALGQTLDRGCILPRIRHKSGAKATVLEVEGNYLSYEWNTGATAAAIEVRPKAPTWYWVTVTGTPRCQESAKILVIPPSTQKGQ